MRYLSTENPFFHNTHRYAAVSPATLSDQVHHKHWEATEHAGDGHVEFSVEGILMKKRVELEMVVGYVKNNKVSMIYSWN